MKILTTKHGGERGMNDSSQIRSSHYLFLTKPEYLSRVEKREKRQLELRIMLSKIISIKQNESEDLPSQDLHKEYR
jgi:hypothetical protein